MNKISQQKTCKMPDHHFLNLAAAEDAGCMLWSICAKLATEWPSYPREDDRRVFDAAMHAPLHPLANQADRTADVQSTPVSQLVLSHRNTNQFEETFLDMFLC